MRSQRLTAMYNFAVQALVASAPYVSKHINDIMRDPKNPKTTVINAYPDFATKIETQNKQAKREISTQEQLMLVRNIVLHSNQVYSHIPDTISSPTSKDPLRIDYNSLPDADQELVNTLETFGAKHLAKIAEQKIKFNF